MDKCVVSDTGPLISVFQSNTLYLLKYLYDKIYISNIAVHEYTGEHEITLKSLKYEGYIKVCQLSPDEETKANAIAERIAQHALTRNGNPEDHYPEAHAIVLAMNKKLNAYELLLDELVAREIAKECGIHIIGFPGILIRCCKLNYIRPENVRDLLLTCQRAGTYYADTFINGIYEGLINEGGNQ